MKNRSMFRTTAVMAFLVLFVCASSAFAENRAGAINVTPWFGGYNIDGDLPYDNGWTAGLSLGYNFTEKLGAELSFNYVETDYDGPITLQPIDFNDDDASIYLYRLDLLYHITGILPEMVVPYLAGGVGMSTFDTDMKGVDSENDFILNYGAGLKYFLSRNMALRADVRHVLDFDGGDTYNNLLYTAGLCFEFGGKGVEPELAPVDSDGDGVTDDIDKCPNTPAGTVVDEWGCPKKAAPGDSDGDGVTDDLDKCPNTPAGCKVDKDGCPLDSDGDGVIDCMDKCPNTPKGVKVDANGCPPAVEQGAIIFRNIQFDLGKATLREESYPILDEVTDYMKANTGVKMEVQGHTCNLGSAAFNLKLSDQRANTVRNYLVENGVAADRLTAKGYGLTQPIAPNDNEENRAKNRRVEFKPIQ
ncbi:MAG TPA: OmpA family protein [Deltaproteobacteria bacterium]|nr:OmpA family protein [Deltaproteobacteria bacterium]